MQPLSPTQFAIRFEAIRKEAEQARKAGDRAAHQQVLRRESELFDLKCGTRRRRP